MEHFPSDVILSILEYIPDIDTRRAFGIYRPISPSKYTPISYCIRTPIHSETYQQRFHFIQFSLPNQCEMETREKQGIENDRLDFEFWVGSNQVLYDIAIHRLKEKTRYYTGFEKDQIYYKGDLNNHYWHSLCITYDTNWIIPHQNPNQNIM